MIPHCACDERDNEVRCRENRAPPPVRRGSGPAMLIGGTTRLDLPSACHYSVTYAWFHGTWLLALPAFVGRHPSSQTNQRTASGTDPREVLARVVAMADNPDPAHPGR